jgi:hypothetical protein
MMKPEHEDLVKQLRDLLPTTTPLERAQLLHDLVRATYDHVKLNVPGGGGIDGRDGPERSGLGDVVNAAHEHMLQPALQPSDDPPGRKPLSCSSSST